MARRDDRNDTRSVTDSKLRVERGRSDEELVERSIAMGETADQVIQRARARARQVLELARNREDSALAAADAGPEVSATIADQRRTADELTTTEYAVADAALVDERSQRRRAIIQLLALERDETDRMLASERHVADRMLAVRDDVLGVVTHDLRSQLSVMLVRVSVILMSSPGPAELAEHMHSLQHGIAQMDALLSDLLDVAAMETGRMRVDPMPTDLAAVLCEEVRVHRPAADARSIALALDVRESPIMASIDAARIQRVLMNLLANALKFTRPGGRVDVVLERCGSEACISVKDTGVGIAPDRLESVFERFSRIDSKTRGYGLGLYIARAIVTAHRGRIWVESTPGEGSTFHIRLPARD